MEIKVLGSGCTNCKKLYELVENTLNEMNLTANLIYVTDMIEIANSGLLRTPGLVINNKIVSYGRIPSKEEIKNFITKS